MARCGEFANHRFKDYSTNAQTRTCVRCGKVHADAARWDEAERTKQATVRDISQIESVQCRVCRGWYRPQWQHAKRGEIFPTAHRGLGPGSWCEGVVLPPMEIIYRDLG